MRVITSKTREALRYCFDNLEAIEGEFLRNAEPGDSETQNTLEIIREVKDQIKIKHKELLK